MKQQAYNHPQFPISSGGHLCRGTEALGDVPYRATTGLIDLPISTTVGIAPANDAIIASFPFSLVSGGHYVVTASGIVGDTDIRLT
ncbi:hypothetical protein Ct9H90mP29_16530 [bacterium]|nr:MAG: hypothetical protein Ct9H90mP29_16530 [bacterium]